MPTDDLSFEFVHDEIEEAIDREINKNKKQITRQEIKNIVVRVLTRCGVEVNKKAGTLSSKGLIDVYHRGLYIAAREADSDAVKLYPLRAGQSLEVLLDEGWRTIEVEENPAAQTNSAELRVRLNVPDDVPIIGSFARIKREIAAPQKVEALPEATKEIEEKKGD